MTLIPRAVAALAAAALLGEMPPGAAAADDDPAAIAADYQTALKARLMAAMAEGGPAHAVTVCRDEAPQIAARLSASSCWTVRRVGTRVRNAATGTADAWEQAQLADMAAQLDAGTPASRLARTAVVAGRERYAAPILATGPCLVCHGDPATQQPAMAEALARDYPQDQATGYRDGALRGAFSLSRPAP